MSRTSGRTATVVLSLLCVPAVFVALAAVLGPIDAAPEIDDSSVTPEYDESGSALPPLGEPRLRGPVLVERGPDGETGDTARSTSNHRTLGLTLLGPDITDVIVGTSAGAVPVEDSRSEPATRASQSTGSARAPRSAEDEVEAVDAGDDAADSSQPTRPGAPPVMPSLPAGAPNDSRPSSRPYAGDDDSGDGDTQALDGGRVADVGRPGLQQG